MKPLIVLVHGWGFEPAFWDPLRSALRDVETVAVDLGFRRAPSIPALPEDRPLIGVGHSLGFAWLLQQPRSWHGLVAINGFARFTRTDDFHDGVPPRLLGRMQTRLGGSPAEVVTDFLRRCGVLEPDADGLQHGQLAAGLGWLADWDARPALAAHRGRLLALAGGADPIVPAAMSRATFADDLLQWREDGGHLLPASHPDWCAAQLSAFLDRA